MKNRWLKRAIVMLLALTMLITCSAGFSFAQSFDETGEADAVLTEATEQTQEKETIETQPKAELEESEEEANEVVADGDDEVATDEAESSEEADVDAEEDADKTVKQTVKVGGAEITAEYDKAAFDGDVTFAAEELTDRQIKKNDDAVDDLVGEDVTATTLFAFDLYFKDDSGKRLEPTDDVKISIDFDKAQYDSVLGELCIVHIKNDGTAEYVDDASFSSDASSAEFTNDQFSPYEGIAKSGDVVQVSTADEFKAVVADLNANGGSKTVMLMDSIEVLNLNPNIRLEKGELTILGEDHTLTASLTVKGTGKLNLGEGDYEKSLVCLSGNNDLGVFNIAGNGELNIYKGVTIGPCSRGGQAGGITCSDSSVVNMYGGTITKCVSRSVSGGIYLSDYSSFNMYDGTITDCEGRLGGAVGLDGADPIGSSSGGSVAFNMSGGTISNCVDHFVGGGAVSSCALFPGYSYPFTFIMSGGTIKNCWSDGKGYDWGGGDYYGGYGGGGIMLFSYTDLTFKMSGGTISGCYCEKTRDGYGGGIMIYAEGSGSDIQFTGGSITGNSALQGGGVYIMDGKTTVSNGFALHNNEASKAGDDIYSEGNSSVTLGTVDTSATLESCGHPITGWYEDANNRWSYKECTGKDDYLELFTHTGEAYSEEYGLKAAHGELYTVKWVNYDGSELETDTGVPEGATPSYDGATPTRPDTADYTYEFAGWNPEISEVTGDVTYTAKYTRTPKGDPTPVDPDDPDEPDDSAVTPADDGDDGGTTPAPARRRTPAAAPAAAAPAAAPAAPAAQPAIEDDPVPQAQPTEIDDPEPPKADEPEQGNWALLNLIAAALTTIGAAIALFRKREDDEDNVDEEDDEDESREKRKLTIAKIAGAALAAASIIAFLLTEDMSLPMAIVDKWTILMAVLFAGQIGSAVVAKNAAETEYEEDEEV